LVNNSKSVATEECSVCESDVWRDVAIALVSEIANELLDPNSLAMQAYNHARNHRFCVAREVALLAARSLHDTTTPGAGTGSPTGNPHTQNKESK
jgi:hypothetical protein